MIFTKCVTKQALIFLIIAVSLGCCSLEEGRASIFNKRAKKLLLKMFKRKLRIPEESSLSLAAQVSRPDIWPGIFNQPDGIIVDAVIELPMWLDIDDFAKAVYSNHTSEIHRAGSFVGTERCFLYDKLEWLLGLVAQISAQDAHSCVLKFICETQAIHTFYPDYPISIAFELIHLILSPSLGSEDPCFHDYVVAENKGRMYGRCDKYESGCFFSVGGLLISNFFPVKESHRAATTTTTTTTTPTPPRTLWNMDSSNFADSGRFNQFFSQFRNML